MTKSGADVALRALELVTASGFCAEGRVVLRRRRAATLGEPPRPRALLGTGRRERRDDLALLRERDDERQAVVNVRHGSLGVVACRATAEPYSSRLAQRRARLPASACPRAWVASDVVGNDARWSGRVIFVSEDGLHASKSARRRLRGDARSWPRARDPRCGENEARSIVLAVTLRSPHGAASPRPARLFRGWLRFAGARSHGAAARCRGQDVAR